jgi:acyl carrier protein
MEAAGARVVVASADVSDRAQIAELLARIEQGLPPLRGVVHAAAAGSDSTVLEQNAERFWATMAPKMHGAWNLHALTADKPLDFFVLYSSVMSLLGAPGNGNYTAANAFLDALAHHRRSMGLPALCVDWGIFSDVGSAIRRAGLTESMANRGMDSLTEAEALKALPRLIASGTTQIAVVRFNVRQWLDYYPNAARSRLWDELRKERARTKPSAPDVVRLREALESEQPAERQPRLERHLSEQLGRVLRMDPSRIPLRATFTSLGMDSLMSLELRNRLEASLGLKLSATLLFTYPHLASLAEHLLGEMALAPPVAVESLRHLEEDDLMNLLDQELSLIRAEKSK